MWQFYLKQNVEIATLSSIARNDIALLDANEFYPVARGDNFFKRKMSSDLLAFRVKDADIRLFVILQRYFEKGVGIFYE